MVATLRSSSDSNTAPDLNIVLRGRAYPFTCRRVLPVPVVPPEERQSAQELERRVFTMLSFPGRTPESFQGSSEIVRAFCNDLVLLESMGEQWREFLRHLRKANISADFTPKIPKRQRQQAINQAFQSMGHESEVMVDDNGILQGDLVERKPVDVHQVLQETLTRVVARFIRVMQSDLDQLSDLRVVGLLEWCGATTCRFHFYEHKLTSVVDYENTNRHSVPMTRNGKTRLGVEIIEELAGRHIHSVTRRAELLIEAKSSAANAAHLVLPKVVRDCIQRCPAWLRSELQVVEGEKVREEWVELVRIENEWKEHSCRQRIQPHFDPALTLFGQFVLMGWDEKIHQKEIRSRIHHNSEQLADPLPSDGPEARNHDLSMMVAAMAAVIFGMLVLVATGETLWEILSPVLQVAGLPPTYKYLTGGKRIWNANETDAPVILTSASIMFTVMAVGYVLAAWVFGKPGYCIMGVIGIVGAILYQLRSKKGGVA